MGKVKAVPIRDGWFTIPSKQWYGSDQRRYVSKVGERRFRNRQAAYWRKVQQRRTKAANVTTHNGNRSHHERRRPAAKLALHFNTRNHSQPSKRIEALFPLNQVPTTIKSKWHWSSPSTPTKAQASNNSFIAITNSPTNKEETMTRKKHQTTPAKNLMPNQHAPNHHLMSPQNTTPNAPPLSYAQVLLPPHPTFPLPTQRFQSPLGNITLTMTLGRLHRVTMTSHNLITITHRFLCLCHRIRHTWLGEGGVTTASRSGMIKMNAKVLTGFVLSVGVKGMRLRIACTLRLHKGPDSTQ